MKTLSFLAAALCLAPLSNGAELETQTGDVIASKFSYYWSYFSPLPDTDRDFDGYSYIDGDQSLSNAVIYNTGGIEYGVEGESHYQTNLSFGNSGPELLQRGPSLPDERFEISGYAGLPDSEYFGELTAGTYATDPLRPSVLLGEFWELYIKPLDGESIGDPIIVEIQAGVSGFVSATGPGSSARAEWYVNLHQPAPVVHTLNELYFYAEVDGYDDEPSEAFNDSITAKFASTIGSTIKLYSSFELEIEGYFVQEPSASTARFDTIDISIRLIDLGCAADINSDGLIDTADLGLLVAHFGSSDQDADINGDGTVDSADLGIVIGFFGLPCN